MINTGVTTTAALTNIPLVRERGVEVEGRASPIENLWITYSGDFNDARYVSYSNAPAPIETGLSSIDLSGKQIIGAPRYSVQGGLYYEHPLGRPLARSATAKASPGSPGSTKIGVARSMSPTIQSILGNTALL